MTAELIRAVEKAVNAYLRLDPQALPQFAQLAGQTVKIKLTDLNMEFYLTATPTHVSISADSPSVVHSTVKASSLTLLRLGLSSEQEAIKQMNKVEISGDVELGRKISQLFSNLSIDWEEQLSKYTGDFIAHNIGSLSRRFIQWSKATSNYLQKSLSDYLQEEMRYLPPREEIENFFSDIRLLANDVERVAARISLLKNRKNSSE